MDCALLAEGRCCKPSASHFNPLWRAFMGQEEPAGVRKDDPSYLNGHALESRRKPGEYIANMSFRAGPAGGESYRKKYATIFEHGGIDLRHNAEQAYEMNFGQWVEMSKDGGPWDYESNPLMREGVQLGLYTPELLVSFRRFHLGFTSSALGLLIQSIEKALRHLGIDASDKSFQKDYGLGLTAYWSSDPRDTPRNDPWFQRGRS